MEEKQIEEVKKIFTKWDPLGQCGKVVKDLDNYNTEAIDFLFYATKGMTKRSLETLAIEIIEEAFLVIIDRTKVGILGEELYGILRKY